VLAVATFEIVSVEVAAPEPGVIVAGEKLQLRALEMFPHESVMGLLSDPDCICAVTINVPALPDAIVTDAGDAPKDTLGVGGGGGGGGVVVAGHEGL
jgi:hypothetical protein